MFLLLSLKIISSFCTVSWHFDTKYPLGYLHRKRYFSSNKTSLYCGLQQNKNNSEEIMEREVAWQIRIKLNRNWSFLVWCALFHDFSTFFTDFAWNIKSIVSPAHSKNQVYVCTVMLDRRKVSDFLSSLLFQ